MVGPPPRPLQKRVDARRDRSREWQAEQLRATGFACHSEIGAPVYAALIARGFRHNFAAAGAHLAAVAGPYNWQGCPRIAALMGRSTRTVQRARAVLERAGLIVSYCLMVGEQLDGMRAPLRRPQVVRDVTPLQTLPGLQLERVRLHVASKGLTPRRRPSSARPSAADRPRPPPAATSQELVSAAEVIAFAARLAEDAKGVPMRSAHGRAAAHQAQQRGDAPPVETTPPAAEIAHEAIDSATIDEWERVTAEMERELRARDGPTERGPPRR